MKRPNIILRWLITAIAVVVLAGCANAQELVSHGFAFDFIDDSPDAELIDYRYGTSYYGRSERASLGRVGQQSGIFGEIRRGDDLYVKWRLKATGAVFEETVDLKSRLPTDIKGSRIYFMVRGPQLFVYLITPEKRAKDEPPNGPARTQYLKTLTIYPDTPKN
ncbi:hypothetical protein [Sulfuritalea sp.]|uniref:hypothetical protein n=1 Tax=Sulfuritalea sp. TaxID=2480090 RepID=UPI001AC499FB|nr:hypothetical protein [Sulfuritalea sp.]MBN8474840.1 hypothetical protein [Sulfuritalea sp.]